MEQLRVDEETYGSDLIGHSSVGSTRLQERYEDPQGEARFRVVAAPVMTTRVDIDKLHITTELL